MTSQRRIDLEKLQNALIRARRRGTRTKRLLDYAPDLIEMLYPAEQHPNLDDDERAQATENLIKAAVDSIGGDVGHALASRSAYRQELSGSRWNSGDSEPPNTSASTPTPGNADGASPDSSETLYTRSTNSTAPTPPPTYPRATPRM